MNVSLKYDRSSYMVLTGIHLSLVETDSTIANKGCLCIVEFRRAIAIGIIRNFVIILYGSSCQIGRGEVK